jgi:hypothetical protein
MIVNKVLSIGVNFFNKPYKAKEPPTSGGIIYVNKFKEAPSQEHNIKTMKILNKSHEIFNNGFNNHKK